MEAAESGTMPDAMQQKGPRKPSVPLLMSTETTACLSASLMLALAMATSSAAPAASREGIKLLSLLLSLPQWTLAGASSFGH